jgi:predicted regulator of Ras-like GTPase activity (Roadblock/LC7/MglB family)
MNRIDSIKSQIDALRGIRGLENAFLAQQDGHPVASTGIWLSQDEIFGVSAAASAIYSVARRLHESHSYTLVEGERAKFLIIALKGNPKYFLALTTRPKVNLGSLFQFVNHCTENVARILTEADNIPPLRSYTSRQAETVTSGFDTAAHTSVQVSTLTPVSTQSLVLTEAVVARLNELLDDFNRLLSGVSNSFISLSGGYPVALTGLPSTNHGTLCAYTFSLFDTCRKIAWLTKRMGINQVTIDYGNNHHFIYNAGQGIFSTTLNKDHVRLGFLRLMIPTFTVRIRETLHKAAQTPDEPAQRPPIEQFIKTLSADSPHVEL